MSGAYIDKVRRQAVVLPIGLDFSDLGMRFGEAGEVLLNVEPIVRVCEASGIKTEVVLGRATQQNLANLITAWYAAHIAMGGQPDLVQEECMVEQGWSQWGDQTFYYAAGHA